jgi:Rab GDP dissociation inhibitor
VKLLLHTQVTRYLDFKPIVGSYVYHNGKVHKVPATDSEAVKSSLMGLFEKRRCQKFLAYVQAYEEEDQSTWAKKDLKTMKMRDLYKAFDLDPNTQDFLGHASALHLNDDYLERPALETIKRLKLYAESVGRYSNSPYIYPLYGLGELPQAFSRLSAVYGTTYMLNAPIVSVERDGAGVFQGITSTAEDKEGTVLTKSAVVVGDPTYFPDKVKKVGEVVKVICILNHPVPNTSNSESCQIIFPQKQLKRKSDIYVAVMSAANCVVPKDKWVAIVSTTVETANPETECEQAIKLLGPIEESFTFVQPLFEPIDDGTKDKIFISTSYDATSHFETTVDDVLDLYRRITGKDLVMKNPEEDKEKEKETAK